MHALGSIPKLGWVKNKEYQHMMHESMTELHGTFLGIGMSQCDRSVKSTFTMSKSKKPTTKRTVMIDNIWIA